MAAKALAYGLGADYLEQDVVATRDRELVVLHDLTLDDVSNVAELFPQRGRPDGHYYVADFDLAELRTLELQERRKPGSSELQFPERFSARLRAFEVMTLNEELDLVAGLNRTTGRTVGIYPEVKHPEWHRAQGIDLGRLMLETLTEHGYGGRNDRIFVQCFDAQELERMRIELDASVRLVQLLEAGELSDRKARGRRLDKISAYADGVGIPYQDLLDRRTAPILRANEIPSLIERAGLELHPYTFRRDWMPGEHVSFEALLELFIVEIGIDGLFCDHPDIAARVRDRSQNRSSRRP